MRGDEDEAGRPILYANGHFYTGRPEAPWAEAMLVACGRILWVGQEGELGTLFVRRHVDLAGATVLPGLVDAHTHFLAHGLLKRRLNLREVANLEQAQASLRSFASAHPEHSWILGHGWNENLWPGRELPSRADLDAAVVDRPVALWRADYHLLWANSRALEAAGIGPGSVDPPGGQIDRDAFGLATGILREKATGIVWERTPEPSFAERVEALRAGQVEALALGLTGVHTAEGAEALAPLQALCQAGELSLRVLFLPPASALTELKEVGLRAGFGDERLRLGQLKLFSDGSLGSHTAWMLAPFGDDPANTGIPIHTTEELASLVREAHEAGWPCAVHAIGDAANRAVLDAFERAGKPPGAIPDRIEHVQIIAPQDMPRLARLGVVASMQPVHVSSDWRAASRLWGERSRHAYAWRSLLRDEATLAFGSDAPVEPLNPWHGLQVALTRRDLDGEPPDGWYPEECLTLAEALAGFTTGAAFAGGEPADGRLAPGARADFVLVERDPFALGPEELGRVRPLATYVGGERVYEA